jgi:hypothetical protein
MAKKSQAARYRARRAALNRIAEARTKKARKRSKETDVEAVAEVLSREEDGPVQTVLKKMEFAHLHHYPIPFEDPGLLGYELVQAKGEAHGATVERFLTTLVEKRARFVIPEYAGTLLNLSLTGPWVRPLADWKPKGRGRDAQFRSLVEHLLCEYPVPHFLYRVFGRPTQHLDTREWLRFFAGVGRGGSVFKLAKKHIPVPLTKKMVHALMQAKGSGTLLSAIRQVQVETFVEDDVAWARRLHAALMGTRIGAAQYTPSLPREVFWATIIQWFAQQAMLDPQQVGPLLDYIAHARAENGAWAIKGRNVASLTRDMETWHNVLHSMRKVTGTRFDPSGYAGLQWREKRTDKQGHSWTYCVGEVLTTKALAAEGRAMRHCVYSYGRSIQSGHVSIWSLRRWDTIKKEHWCETDDEMKTTWTDLGDFNNAEHVLTIEVSNRTSTIVQVRGKLNRMAGGKDQGRVHKWARHAELQIPGSMWKRWA